MSSLFKLPSLLKLSKKLQTQMQYKKIKAIWRSQVLEQQFHNCFVSCKVSLSHENEISKVAIKVEAETR